MKQFNSMLEYYQWSLKRITISMPLCAIVAVIVGIVCGVIYEFILWGILIGVAIGLLTIIMFIFIRKYMLKKIAELEKQEQNNGD